MRGSYVVETRAICLAFFLQKKMHKILPQNSRNLILLILDRRKDTNHYFNISLNSQSRNIRILLTLPSEIEDSHALYHIIGQVLIRMNQGVHQKLKNRIGVLASESDSPVRVGIISCNRKFLKAMKVVENRGLSISGIITKPTKPFK
ncbi:unnamed protein product [Rhizophagus irregularis]|nr:unnamed protein product [Rhizophagus irregularis]